MSFQSQGRTKWLASLLLLSLLWAQTSALRGAETDKKLEPVTLQLKWRHQFQFAGYYAAVAQGYYREAGLEVSLREAQPGKDPVKAVLAGEAEFGVGTSEIMLLRAKNRPVVVLAAIFQHSPLVLLALRGNGINDLHDLGGRPIMIEPQSAELFAYFKVEGLAPRGLKIQHHTFLVEDLIQKRVAAMSAYSTDEPFQLQAAKVDYLMFTPQAGGIDFYGDNLFTTEEQIRRFPDRVRAFRAASLKGWDYALAHREEMVDLILRDYDRRKTRQHLLFEAERTASLMHPELIEVGHMNPGRWRHIADTYAEFKMVPANLDLAGFVYDPHPRPLGAWIYWALGITAAGALAALGWALPLYRLNGNLKRQVSERRAAEENLRHAKEAAEAADRAKGRYLAFLAHEVRTPLGGIVGMMGLIGQEPLTALQRVNLSLAEGSAHAVLKLIDSALDFSKLQENGLHLDSRPVHTRQFLEEIRQLFEVPAKAKGLELDFVIEASVPAVFKSDPTRLRQILSHLLSNAIKFTATGRVSLRVSAPAPPDNAAVTGSTSHKLAFVVRDTGKGIPPEELNLLFEPHVQAGAASGFRPGSAGLGLPISRRLAHLLGGDIHVRSSPGEGSTFTLEVLVESTGTGP